MTSGVRDWERIQAFSRSPGNTQQENITAGVVATTITFDGTTSSIMIQNLSGQFVQFSFDGGTTWTDLNPYQAFENPVSTSSVQIRRKSGSADASVQVVATYGKA